MRSWSTPPPITGSSRNAEQGLSRASHYRSTPIRLQRASYYRSTANQIAANISLALYSQ
ncbi:unnamed protein product [Ixodes pacificus]